MTPKPVKKPSAGKNVCVFNNILYVKNNTAICRFGAANLKRKTIKLGTTQWALKPKQKGNSKINNQIKKSLYNFIMHHPQVVQSPIFNDCQKVDIDGHTEPNFFPERLLQISV